MKRYFNIYPGTPPIDVKGDYRCSVHYGNEYRLEKARKQIALPKVDRSIVADFVLEFLKRLGFNSKCNPILENPLKIDYRIFAVENELDDIRDIIWLKFTSDGFLGVVAVSNDINFEIPKNAQEYDVKIKKYNSYRKKEEYVWKYPSSGILVHQLEKRWDESFVLIFPLPNLHKTGYTRDSVERAVGNYLIDKGVPIIDFYSHNY